MPAPSAGESETCKNNQRHEQRACFQVISPRFLWPSPDFSGPTQNGGHQSEESYRLRKESQLPTHPIVATGGKRAEERSREWSQKHGEETVLSQGFRTVQPGHGVE